MVRFKENTYKLMSDCLYGNDDRSGMVRKLTEMSCWTIVEHVYGIVTLIINSSFHKLFNSTQRFTHHGLHQVQHQVLYLMKPVMGEGCSSPKMVGEGH